MITRRQVLVAAPLVALSRRAGSARSSGSYGIAYTSVIVRASQARRAAPRGPAIPAEDFMVLCHDFGAAGVQMDIKQIDPADAATFGRVRARAEKLGMFIELSVPPAIFEDAALLDAAALAAKGVGATCLRTACLSGRRYQDFRERKDWDAFAQRWWTAVPGAEAALRRHKLIVGIENHKDWRTDELADLLGKISSPYIGACVDFGNNLSLMESPLETVEKLAPFAVTTHLKDLSVTPHERGFLLGDVAPGEGVIPVGKIVEVLRRKRPDVHFCLEMMTRDALEVPYKDDSYWATWPARDQGIIRRFERDILSRASKSPPPKISTLTPPQALAAEDANLRRWGAYAKKLGL